MDEKYLYGIIIVLLLLVYNFYDEARAHRIYANEFRNKKIKSLNEDVQEAKVNKPKREINPDC